jgi:SAM-dependent methyltransferase
MNRREWEVSVASNGLLWSLGHLLREKIPVTRSAVNVCLRAIARGKGVPGDSINNTLRNYRTWQEWPWQENLDPWTSSQGWKQGFLEHVVRRYMPQGGAILEVGPGNGRWTETLKDIASHLTVVDLSDVCIAECRKRFAGSTNITYVVNNGVDLRAVPDASVDAIFSFDVFVHITPQDTAKYVAEFARVLKPGGIGVIHHSRDGKPRNSYRSETTAEAFRAMVERSGLTFVTQFDQWDGHRVWLRPMSAIPPHHQCDAHTVFTR